MIKIQNNTATREAIPAFLQGLAPESLADLSWTDPALGVSDCAWWPEVDQSPTLGQHERYGEETLTINYTKKNVNVTKAIVPFSEDEKAAITNALMEQKRNEIAALRQRLSELENEQ
jgi:hypothetical protein